MRVFLSGPAGAGKTTVAAMLAGKLGLPVVDLDSRVAERAGCSLIELFSRGGEAEFRAIEQAEAARVCREPACVVALGGGTVAHEVTRRLLLSRGVLVTLDADPIVLSKRLEASTPRPLLGAGEVVERLTALTASRSGAYAECHGRVRTDGQRPDQVAEAVLAIAVDPPVLVALGDRSYRVEIGSGVRGRLGRRARETSPSGHVVLVTDEHIAEGWARESREHLEAGGCAVTQVTLDAGEAHKDLDSVERVWDMALSAGIDRTAMVLGVGGGVVGDVAGFAASTLLRGVALGQLPTSLLAMVDSAVGGKTGIDRPQGKNLVGTFHAPRFVLADVELLSSLPREERTSGLAEVVKSAWLAGEEAVVALEGDVRALQVGEPEATERAVRMAVETKARIVSDDEREAGPRRLLNLGHTVGHALEVHHGYGALRHGHAVALGMVAAFRVAALIRGVDAAAGRRAQGLLRALGLPTDLEQHLSLPALEWISADKKREAGGIHFVLPAAPGDVIVEQVPTNELRRALATLV